MANAASRQRKARPGNESGWVKEHGLLLANIGLFLVFFGGMILSEPPPTARTSCPMASRP